jgi:small subunit ribosomal protein S9
MAEDRNSDTATQTPQAPAGSASFQAKAPAGDQGFFWGTGRRKKSIARVRIRPGSGTFTVKGRDVEDYFLCQRDLNSVNEPLSAVNMKTAWDIAVTVKGGGKTGQAGAIALGLARALADAVPDAEHTLRDHGLLTRDARAKERKKYGQKGARKRFQFSKR